MSASLHDPEPLLAPPQEAAGAEAGVDAFERRAPEQDPYRMSPAALARREYDGLLNRRARAQEEADADAARPRPEPAAAAPRKGFFGPYLRARAARDIGVLEGVSPEKAAPERAASRASFVARCWIICARHDRPLRPPGAPSFDWKSCIARPASDVRDMPPNLGANRVDWTTGSSGRRPRLLSWKSRSQKRFASA